MTGLLLQIREAFANLATAKLRSFLAVLGILVGTGSVVAMVSSGQLATQQALAQFKGLGTDLLALSMYSNNSSSGSLQELEFILPDAVALEEQEKAITTLAPYSTTYAPIAFQGKKLSGNVIGTTESLQDVINIEVEEGRFISILDKYSSFCIIGHKLSDTLEKRGYTNLIGQQLQLGDTIFTIVGVAAPWAESSFFNQNINESVIIPLESAKLISKYSHINNVVMKIMPNTDIKSLEEDIKIFIHQKVPTERLFFRSAQQLINSMVHQKQILTLLLALIGSISLLVGGIGVMNIMLVSVVERRREIGIRMAVGARRRDIQFLFLIEAITLALFGGLMGVILGVLTSFIIAYFAKWHFIIFLLPPLVGFLVSVAVGVFFGFYPAYQASRLDPIEALRSD